HPTFTAAAVTAHPASPDSASRSPRPDSDTTCLAPDRSGQQQCNSKWEQPPSRDAAALERPGERDRGCETDGDAPVVADHEVPPEPEESANAAHVTATRDCGACRNQPRRAS